MTTTIEPPELVMPEETGGPDGHTPGADHAHDDHAHHEGPTGILNWLTSTDHKVIGKSYMITSLVLFFIAGIMALSSGPSWPPPPPRWCRSRPTTSCSPCTAA